ncbi:MAG TPA: PGF-CTERM sorting domain-containing protein, partial [Methanothrix sp.]|nr:PGF-CTERM sorting domain-containing protein [Methanothrix sp.]
IMMNNEDNKITLSKDKDQLLMENIRIKTADQDDITAEEPLRFYIYEEATIEEAGAAAEQPEPQVKEAPVEEAAVEEAPVEEAPAEEAPVEEAAVEEAPAEEAPAEENMTEEAPAEEEAGGIPGFEAVFAITGLLAVSYLVLRRRE